MSKIDGKKSKKEKCSYAATTYYTLNVHVCLPVYLENISYG